MIINEKIKLKTKIHLEKFNADLYIYDVDEVQVVFMNTTHNVHNEYAFCATIYNNHNDNKGLPHLLEHCIFGGSKNHDYEEPFERLVQNEKYTYLNAITFRDRITCLFSTYNEDSFSELLDVYLDAIYNPLLNEKTFNQECFRIEKNQTGSKIKNGIVYNEMIEMYSDIEYYNENMLTSSFNTNYFKYNAHGKPSDIEEVTNADVVKYYTENFVKNNIVLSFYGCNNHETILKKILEITKDAKDVKADIAVEVVNDNCEINIECKDNKIYILISYECENIFEENALIIICKTIFSAENIKTRLGSESNLKIDSNSRKTLISVSVEFDKDFVKLHKHKVIEFILLSIDDMNLEDIKLNLFDMIIASKVKDFGYKTEGVFSLLEISKLNTDKIQQYFKVEKYNEVNNELDMYNSLTVSAFNLKASLTKFDKENAYNIQKNSLGCLNFKKNEEKLDKLFKSFTKCDIIDIIIIIKFKKMQKKCVKSFNLNSLIGLMNEKNFKVVEHYNRNLGNKTNELYTNLRVFTNEIQKSLEYLSFILQNNVLYDMFDVETNEKVISKNSLQSEYLYSNSNIHEIVDYELSLLDDLFAKQNKNIKDIDNFDDNEICRAMDISWEMYTCNFNSFTKVASSESLPGKIVKYKNESYLELNSSEIRKFKELNEGVAQVDNEVKNEVNNEVNNEVKNEVKNVVSNEVKYAKNDNLNKKAHTNIVDTVNVKSRNEFYKNVLVIDIASGLDKIDHFYIELILEALINENLYKIIRLKNGAYEVNYKLFKLENKVVIYSNIDKYSIQTLEIFKQEVNNLNELSLSTIKKYSNKITNNFYRNEQNKNIKIYKNFVNYITNYNIDNKFIEDSKIVEAISILQNSKIVLEKSYS